MRFKDQAFDGGQDMAIALALLLVVVGSVLFHILSPWWLTPIASNWNYLDLTLAITFWVTGIAFAAVILFMAYCVFRFRHTEGRKASYEPENKRLEGWLTIGTAVGVAAMLAPGLYVWALFINVPPEAAVIEVVAQQWLWNYRLPGEDGKLGSSSNRMVSYDNPLGLDPRDPDNQDDIIIEADALHLPVSKPVKVCCVRSMSCTAGTCPSFAPKWTRCRAGLPISGSRRQKLEPLRPFAPNCAASVTGPCVVPSSSIRRKTTKRGCRSSRPLRNCRLPRQ